MYRERFASLCLIIACCVTVGALPRPQTTDHDVVMVEDIVSLNPTGTTEVNVALITLSESQSSEENSSSNSKEDSVSDDLIFLTHKSRRATETQRDASASEEQEDSEEEEEDEEETVPATPPATPIDMSSFVALIPTQQIQAIVSNYYQHDAEVQRAYRYLNSDEFAEKRQKLIQLPEVLAFTGYFNASGLDVLKLAKTLVQNITAPLMELPKTVEDNSTWACDEMALPEENHGTNSTGEQVKGLQGLVESVLEAVPSDQILATFFDKIEADQQFSKLVDSIGTPKFSKILNNLKNSGTLRYQLDELQHCGINISQIVESLKTHIFISIF